MHYVEKQGASFTTGSFLSESFFFVACRDHNTVDILLTEKAYGNVAQWDTMGACQLASNVVELSSEKTRETLHREGDLTLIRSHQER